jgi:hypothetical protein
MPKASSGVWSSGNVLVVPPLEAVWLTGSELQLQEGRGCLSFEVKGEACKLPKPVGSLHHPCRLAWCS